MNIVAVSVLRAHTHTRNDSSRTRCMHEMKRSHARPTFVVTPLALVRADARAPALLACAPDALVLAEARAPALLACAGSGRYTRSASLTFPGASRGRLLA